MSNESKAQGSGKWPRSQSAAGPVGADQPSTDRARQQAAASRRQQRATAANARRRRKRVIRWGGGVIALALLVLAAVLYQQSNGSDAPPGSAELPAPRDEPEVAMDVNSLVGQPAPSFTLADSEGNSYTITPGGDRPIALITHMGIT